MTLWELPCDACSVRVLKESCGATTSKVSSLWFRVWDEVKQESTNKLKPKKLFLKLNVVCRKIRCTFKMMLCLRVSTYKANKMELINVMTPQMYPAAT